MRAEFRAKAAIVDGRAARKPVGELWRSIRLPGISRRDAAPLDDEIGAAVAAENAVGRDAMAERGVRGAETARLAHERDTIMQASVFLEVWPARHRR